MPSSSWGLWSRSLAPRATPVLPRLPEGFEAVHLALARRSREEVLIVLLGLDKCFLEQVGVCRRELAQSRPRLTSNSLSLLANLMARVCASGSPSLTSAETFQTQLRSLPTLGESFMSGVTVTGQRMPGFVYLKTNVP